MSVQSGRDAESRAAVFLAGRGYRILRRNYTVRGAEVDIIAKDGETYVFVEVKSLSSLAHGAPARARHGRKAAPDLPCRAALPADLSAAGLPGAL